MTQNKLHADWQIDRIMSEIQQASDSLAHIGPAVSIFGSARIRQDSPWYIQTQDIAGRLAAAGIAVIAGGGPGLMEAANKGAHEQGGTSIGLNISLPHEPTNNPYQTLSLPFEYFVSRKAAFFMHSIGYIAMPGGFGTLDELFEALTLIQTGKLPAAPIVLVGSSYWNGLIDWLREQLQTRALIGPNDLGLLEIEDDTDRIVERIIQFAGCVTQDAGSRESCILP